jgi:hypothetical protein
VGVIWLMPWSNQVADPSSISDLLRGLNVDRSLCVTSWAPLFLDLTLLAGPVTVYTTVKCRVANEYMGAFRSCPKLDAPTVVQGGAKSMSTVMYPYAPVFPCSQQLLILIGALYLWKERASGFPKLERELYLKRLRLS